MYFVLYLSFNKMQGQEREQVREKETCEIYVRKKCVILIFTLKCINKNFNILKNLT